MELRDIEYFAVIAEHGHLGRAADALGLSQPAQKDEPSRSPGIRAGPASGAGQIRAFAEAADEPALGRSGAGRVG